MEETEQNKDGEEISDEELARRMRHDAINKKFQETLLKALQKSGMVLDQNGQAPNSSMPEIKNDNQDKNVMSSGQASPGLA